MCRKEGSIFLNMYSLPGSKQANDQELLPTPKNRFIQLTSMNYLLLQYRCQIRISSTHSARRGCFEDYI